MARANRVCTTPSDPIYAAIERHKNAVRLWAVATAIGNAFPDGANPMTLEQQAQIDAAVAGARLPLIDAGLDLIETAPSTVDGIVAALEYIRDQMHYGGAFMPADIVLDDTAAPRRGWLDIFVDTLADAAGDILAQQKESQT